MQLVKVPNDRLLWGLSALILAAALLVTPGFFSIDEAIYYLGGRALAEGGALALEGRVDNPAMRDRESCENGLRFACY